MSPVFTVPPLAWVTYGSAPAAFNSLLGDLSDGHSVAGTGRGAVTKTALWPVKCLHPPPFLQPRACGTGATSVLGGSATTMHCTSSTSLRQLPDTSNSSSRFPQAPSSCSYVLTLALPLLTTQAALGMPCPHPAQSKPGALPGGHGAHAWHCQEGMEHMCGSTGRVWSTRVALLGGHEAHTWH